MAKGDNHSIRRVTLRDSKQTGRIPHDAGYQQRTKTTGKVPTDAGFQPSGSGSSQSGGDGSSSGSQTQGDAPSGGPGSDGRLSRSSGEALFARARALREIPAEASQLLEGCLHMRQSTDASSYCRRRSFRPHAFDLSDDLIEWTLEGRHPRVLAFALGLWPREQARRRSWRCTTRSRKGELRVRRMLEEGRLLDADKKASTNVQGFRRKIPDRAGCPGTILRSCKQVCQNDDPSVKNGHHEESDQYIKTSPMQRLFMHFFNWRSHLLFSNEQRRAARCRKPACKIGGCRMRSDPLRQGRAHGRR